MRELMLENAEGKSNLSLEGSSILLADNMLDNLGQPFPNHCGGGKCKDGASRESRLPSDQSQLTADLGERGQCFIQIGPRVRS